ncbi:MAG: Molybdate/tungstate import ATP-binding protein WtpC [Methanosaeta sp. PtaB.Bin039]|nr:MAG: Molybdate/tungstate import ATP-binding protein WtpC [Methanosaeta sp. PtaB.Bin039]
MIDYGAKIFFKRFIRPRAVTIGILAALSFVGASFSFIIPLFTKSLVDDVFLGGRSELFYRILVGTACLYIVSALSSYFSSLKKRELDLLLFNDVAREAFNSIQLAEIKKTQEIKIGDMISRIMTNTRSAISMFTFILPEFAVIIVRIIVPLVIMFLLHFWLTWAIVIPSMLFIIPTLFFGRRLEITQKASLVKNASVHSFLKEALSMMPLIKAFGLERWSDNKFNERMRDYYDASIDHSRNSSLNGSINSLMYGVPVILLILFGGPMVIQDSLSIGTFAAFMSYVALVFGPMAQLAYLWSYYKISSPALDRVNELFQLEQEKVGEEHLVLSNGVITFNDIWFSYDNRPILKGFNATFTKGLNYVIGDNGAGKSTILKLLCSLYSSDKGRIIIDGHDLSNVKTEDIRRNVSMIFSNPYIFDGSIYENIHIGDLSASREEVIRAAEKVKAHEFIMKLPNGYETQVGESGLKLSSGERQKIALARGILKDSAIILLDEVTKSVDIDSRKAIHEAIGHMKDDKTILIITHDPKEIAYGSNIIHLRQ